MAVLRQVVVAAVMHGPKDAVNAGVRHAVSWSRAAPLLRVKHLLGGWLLDGVAVAPAALFGTRPEMVGAAEHPLPAVTNADPSRTVANASLADRSKAAELEASQIKFSRHLG